jgi:hypothetical protein
VIQDDYFLDTTKVIDVESIMLGANFPWIYSNRIIDPTVSNHKILNVDEYNGFQFTHVFYHGGRPQSDYYELALSVFYEFCNRHKIEPRAILRAKANLTTQDIRGNGIMPHVDHPFDHNVFLYYVNDSDGDTILFKEKFQTVGEEVELTVDQFVPPVAGRAINFDGRTYHAPTIPQRSRARAVINITYI